MPSPVGEIDGPGNGRFLAAVLPAATVPLAGALIYFVFFSGETWARWIYVLVKLFTLVWPLAALPLLLGRRLPRLDWKWRVHRAAVFPGLVFGGIVLAATAVLMATPLLEVLSGYAGRIRLKVSQLGVLEHYLAFGFFLAVFHSGLEEYYWRWFLFGTVRRRLPLAAAAGLSSLAFAAHHVVVLSQYFPVSWVLVGSLAVFSAGVVWCLMYERQESLAGAWISHVLVDVAVLWGGHRLLF